MAHQPIKTTGGIVRHALGVLLRCWLRAFRAGAIVGTASFLLVEIIGSIVAHHFPPPGPTQLLAVALGGALAYGAAATVLADEIILGIIDAIRLLLGEAEAGARSALAIAEHEAGGVWGGVLRLTGHHRVIRPRTLEQPTGLSPETLAELATLAPGLLRTRVPARPLRPSEMGVATPDSRPSPAAAPVATSPTPPDARPDSSATRPAAPPVSAPIIPAAPPVAAPVMPAAPPGVPPSPAITPTPAAPATSARATIPLAGEALSALGALAEPSTWQTASGQTPSAADWHDPTASRAAVAESEAVDEGGIQPVDLFGAPPPAASRAEPAEPPAPVAPTSLAPPPPVPAARPLPNTLPLPEQTRPLDATTKPLLPTDGGMWDHISQMLAGRAIEPVPEDTTPPPDSSATGG